MTVVWGDITDEILNRSVTISYQTETLGEESDFAGIRSAVLLDLGAISAFLNRAIYAHLLAAPHTVERGIPTATS